MFFWSKIILWKIRYPFSSFFNLHLAAAVTQLHLNGNELLTSYWFPCCIILHKVYYTFF